MSSFKDNSSISVKLFPFGRSLNTCIGLLPYFPPIQRLWNATSGGKFEAFRSQSFHARLNTAKTNIVNVVLMRPDKTE